MNIINKCPSEEHVRNAYSVATYNYGFIVPGWRRDREHAENLEFMRALALSYGE